MGFTLGERPRRHVASIDITPLMDLTFMLLIIFIITTPSLEYSTDVTPPPMQTPHSVEELKDKVAVSLGADGHLLIDGQVIRKEDLPGAFRQLALNRPDANLMIISDGSRLYEEVIEIHRMANHAGVKRIFLVTQAEASH